MLWKFRFAHISSMIRSSQVAVQELASWILIHRLEKELNPVELPVESILEDRLLTSSSQSGMNMRGRIASKSSSLSSSATTSTSVLPTSLGVSGTSKIVEMSFLGDILHSGALRYFSWLLCHGDSRIQQSLLPVIPRFLLLVWIILVV